MPSRYKKILALTAVTSFVSLPAAAQERDDNHIRVGVGALMIEAPFKGEDTRIFPLPILSIKQGPLYLEGGEAGVALDAPIAGFTPSLQLFVAARNTVARDRQKITADGGARIGLTSSLGTLSAAYRHDITGTFDGGEFILRYQVPIEMGRVTISPAAQISFLDRATANHMYGVTTKQRARAIRKGRDVILPVAPITDNAMNLGGDITATFQISDRLTMVGVLGGTYLDKTIHRSAAIDQKWESQAVVGLIYSF
ncbi:MAG TPA: MipA/OmpV family protein [Sphingopyxis sp.]|jgi:outer membrane protein|uniref:MipA/OmpV family protein n=1 Tax=Sphingopyxis sp. TaxID=1908224 RepID=UPI002E13A616|nr:MipA/OmpV family protein [Sphingopyxis sp.]